jgi:sugar/nucleoside kinase (ribokinase family)
MKPFDILVAGEINPDLILSGEVEPAFGQVEKLVEAAALTVGSSSAIFACGAARLGLHTAFIGLCGEDVFGRFMLDAMQARGVDTSAVVIDRDGQTGLSVILNRGADRAILTHPGLIPSLKAESIPDELLRQARHLHVASYFLQTALQPGLLELFRRARLLGLTISLDTNWDPSSEWRGFDELLRLVDVFLPNENEALALTRTTDPRQALDALCKTCPTVAIKLGAQGGLACQNGQTVSAPSLPVQVVDTVGAGDTFDTGFLYGYLNGWPLEKSLQLACACGSLSTLKPGGTQGQPTLEQALDALRNT